ncbi:MAG: class I SAM-dependent methyltransferase [Candidatus Bathyarchaeia archaeon]
MNDIERRPESTYGKKIFFEDRIFHVFNGVYEPAEDTFLLAENLQVKHSDVVLEIGCGCGILSILSAFKALRVVAVDINPYATVCTKLNAKDNGVSEKIDVLQGDLFGPLRENPLFDLVIFNAPYLPTEKDELRDWIDYAWAGGREGRKQIDRFILSVSQHLKPGGRLLLVQSTLSNVNETMTKLQKHGFIAKIIGERKVAFETITLIKAEKPREIRQKPQNF